MAEQAVMAFQQLPQIDGLPAWSVPMATARAGNVVGGGDWSSERLVPDCIRAFLAEEPVLLRFPSAVRPWQHVLEPLNGYLLLAESLATGGNLMHEMRGVDAFNFGPNPDGERTVGEVAAVMAEHWGGSVAVVGTSDGSEPPENPTLRLNSTRARKLLGWTPRWDLPMTLSQTSNWYRRWADGADAAGLIDEQLADYVH